MVTILAFLFVLGVLIFVHELGHYLMARAHGVRVITFSLGFGPKLLKVTRGGTEYCISIVPLGGYVKLAGEHAHEAHGLDGSGFSAGLSTPAEESSPATGAPDELMSKSRWVRFQVFLAGPVMNILLALVVLAGVLSRGADEPLYKSSPPVIGTVAVGSPAEAAGLRAGDRIVSVDGRDVPTWDDFDLAVLPKARQTLTIVAVRDGARIDVKVTPNALGHYEMGDVGILPVQRPQVLTVQTTPPGPAARAGLKNGDVIVALDGARGLPQDQIIARIRKSANTPLIFTVERDGATSDVSVVPEMNGGQAMIGVTLNAYEVRRIDPTVPQAMVMSVQQNWNNAKLIGRTLRGLVTRETPMRQLMGPVAIAELSGTAAQLGWLPLLNLMAMISLNLGLLNLMPVPVLDGGHIAILAVEGIARRDLSIKVKERILMAGAALIVLLMVTVIYNDVARLIR